MDEWTNLIRSGLRDRVVVVVGGSGVLCGALAQALGGQGAFVDAGSIGAGLARPQKHGDWPVARGFRRSRNDRQGASERHTVLRARHQQTLCPDRTIQSTGSAKIVRRVSARAVGAVRA